MKKKQFDNDWKTYTAALQRNASVISEENKSDDHKPKITNSINHSDLGKYNIQGNAKNGAEILKDVKKADERRIIEGKQRQNTQENNSKIGEKIQEEESEKRIVKEDISYKRVHKEIIQTDSEVQSKNHVILIFETLKNAIEQPKGHTAKRFSSKMN